MYNNVRILIIYIPSVYGSWIYPVVQHNELSQYIPVDYFGLTPQIQTFRFII